MTAPHGLVLFIQHHEQNAKTSSSAQMCLTTTSKSQLYSWYVQQFVGPQKPRANRSELCEGSVPTLLIVQNLRSYAHLLLL